MAYDDDIGSTPSISTISGAIFMSNRSTMKKCLRLKLFALPLSYQRLVMEIRAGMVLFLFEYEERKLYGVFEAACDGSLNIIPYAFTSSVKPFNAQVRFTRLWHCDPLTEREFYPAIRDNYYTHRKFHFDLSEEQVLRLLHLFDLKTKKGYQKKPISDMYAKSSVPYWTPSPSRLKLKAYQGSGIFRKKQKGNDHVKSFLYQDSAKHDPDYLTNSNGSFLGRDVSPSAIRSLSYSKIYGSHISKEKQFVFSESPWNFMCIGKDPVSPLCEFHQGNLSSANFFPTSVSSSRNACIEHPSIAFTRNACIEGSQNNSPRQHLDSMNLSSSEYLPINVSSTQAYLCQSHLDQEDSSSSNFLPRSVSSSSAEAYLGIRSLQDCNTSYLSSFDYEGLRGRTEAADVGCRYRQSIYDYQPHTLSTLRTLQNTQNCEGLKAYASLLGESNAQEYSQMCNLEDTIQGPRFWDSGHSYTYIPDTEISDEGMVSGKTESLNDSDSLKWQGMYNEEELSMHYPWHDSKTLAAVLNCATDINSETNCIKTSVFSRLSDGRISQEEEEYLRMMDDDPSVHQIMSHLGRLRNKCQRSRLCQTTAGAEQSSENVKMVPNRTSDFAYKDECHDYIGLHSEKRTTKIFNFKRKSEAYKVGDGSMVCSAVNPKRRLARPSISQISLGNGNSKHQDGKNRDCKILGDASKASSETDIASDHENINEIDKCKGITGTARRRKLTRPSFSQVSLGNRNGKHQDGKIRNCQILADVCPPNKASSETNIASDHENINEIDEGKGIAGATRRKLTRLFLSQVSLGNGNSKHQDCKNSDCHILGDGCISNKASSETDNASDHENINEIDEYKGIAGTVRRRKLTRHQDGKIRDFHILEDAYVSNRASSEIDIALAHENINENNEYKEIAGTGRMPVHQINRRKLTRPYFSQVSLGNGNSKHQDGKIRDFHILEDVYVSNRASSETDIALAHENINENNECKEIAGTGRMPVHQINRRKLTRPSFSQVSLGNENSKHQAGEIRDCQILGDVGPYNKAGSEKDIASDHENFNEIAGTDRMPTHQIKRRKLIRPTFSEVALGNGNSEHRDGKIRDCQILGDAYPYNKASSEKDIASDYENINEIDKCKGIARTSRMPAHLGTQSEICDNHNPELSLKMSARKTEELSKECESQDGELGDASIYSNASSEKDIASDHENINEIDECKGIAETGRTPAHLGTLESELCNNHNLELSSKTLVQKTEELFKECEAQAGEPFVESLGVPFYFTEEKFKCQPPQNSSGLYMESYGLSEKGTRCTKKSKKLEVDCTRSSKKILHQDEETSLIHREKNQKGSAFYNSDVHMHAAAETTLSREENESHAYIKPLLTLAGVDLQNCTDNRVSGRDALFYDANTEVIDMHTKYDINKDVPVDVHNLCVQRSVGNINNLKGELHEMAASREDKDLSTIVEPSLQSLLVDCPIFIYNQVNGRSTAMPEAYNGKNDLRKRMKSIDRASLEIDDFLTHRSGRSVGNPGDQGLDVETGIPGVNVEWCPPECRYENILAACCSQKEIKQENVSHNIDVNAVVHDSGNRVPYVNEESIPLFDVLKGDFLDSSNCFTELSVEDDHLQSSSWEHATENMRAASPLNK